MGDMQTRRATVLHDSIFARRRWTNHVETRDPPTGEFVSAAAAEQVLNDVIEIFSIYDVTAEVVRICKGHLAFDYGHSVWLGQLALNRCECVKTKLVDMGVPSSRLDVKVINGPEEGLYFQYHF